MELVEMISGIGLLQLTHVDVESSFELRVILGKKGVVGLIVWTYGRRQRAR